MDADYNLCSLFSSTQAPELFIEVLVAVSSGLKGSIAHAGPIEKGHIFEQLALNTSSAVRVISMAKKTHGFRPAFHMRNIIIAGLFQLMDNCVSAFASQALDGEVRERLKFMFTATKKFTRSPKVLRPLLSELEHHVAIKSALVTKEPTLKASIEAEMPSLRVKGRCLRKEEWVTVCDNLKRHLAPEMVGTGLVNYALPKTCSNCHSVVYCSPQCQREDWSARHRKECREMCIDYLERSYANLSYSYSTRASHLSSIWHTFETLAVTFGNPFTSNARVEATLIEPSRGATGYVFVPLPKYTATFEPFIPTFKRERFNDILEPFRHQIARLAHLPSPLQVGLPELNLMHWVELAQSFDIHLIVLLRRVRITILPPAAYNYNVQRDPKVVGSDYEIVQVMWFFTSPIRCWRDEIYPCSPS
ncbi:hypothetical protein D9611_009555 [Ephemerocybe angulata]|uniref:MYND-type domain-containing protein n=1 Tax=Ephemerocybe angulata TaxID=980116 RepID=A0A8H5AVK5_9AGAR|nr:hypothetical protein D9611_009555 [Tulosesus angulatus]